MEQPKPGSFDDVVWTQFCQRLADAGKAVLARAAGDALDQGEGLRYLGRAVRYALLLQFESGDPDFPRLVRSSDETLKFFSDSPDYYYLMGTVSGSRDYLIRGTRGAAEVMAFSTYGRSAAGVICTGELAVPNLALNPDGSFEIAVSATPRAGNWLPMEANTSFMQVRNIFRDHRRRNPAEVYIERIGRPCHPTAFGVDSALSAMQRVEGQIGSMLDAVIRFQQGIRERVGVNQFDHDQSTWQSIGGAKNTHYVQGLFELGEDEALIVESDVPACSYFSFQLNNTWLESLDYSHRCTYGSLYSAKRSLDGRVTFVIAARDPGVGNWLDTCGHRTGCMVWKWNHPDNVPNPTVRKTNLGSVIPQVCQNE